MSHHFSLILVCFCQKISTIESLSPTRSDKSQKFAFRRSGSSPGRAVGYQVRGPGFESSQFFKAPLCPPSTKWERITGQTIRDTNLILGKLHGSELTGRRKMEYFTALFMSGDQRNVGKKPITLNAMAIAIRERLQFDTKRGKNSGWVYEYLVGGEGTAD
ncbi:hypothetical protein PoB_003840900 [Plakobranchus ocellatus]|uniref:Uncharacterized protein n=1 Tax=Plakobranchus ocellatus TaxID=259542 RepID=A0AAV4AZS4_9GAST|nr:hypothetical protein PoB_003840900 [Plakobranchus ocellatus]